MRLGPSSLECMANLYWGVPASISFQYAQPSRHRAGRNLVAIAFAAKMSFQLISWEQFYCCWCFTPGYFVQTWISASFSVSWCPCYHLKWSYLAFFPKISRTRSGFMECCSDCFRAELKRFLRHWLEIVDFEWLSWNRRSFPDSFFSFYCFSSASYSNWFCCEWDAPFESPPLMIYGAWSPLHSIQD
jgi:hypothetical protein